MAYPAFLEAEAHYIKELTNGGANFTTVQAAFTNLTTSQITVDCDVDDVILYHFDGLVTGGPDFFDVVTLTAAGGAKINSFDYSGTNGLAGWRTPATDTPCHYWARKKIVAGDLDANGRTTVGMQYHSNGAAHTMYMDTAAWKAWVMVWVIGPATS